MRNEDWPLAAVKEGDFIHYSKFFDVEGQDESEYRENCWGRATRNYAAGGFGVEMFHGGDVTYGHHGCDSSDTGVIIPKNKLPEDIWAAYVAWRLSK